MLLKSLLYLSAIEWLPGFLRHWILRALDSWMFATLETNHYARVHSMSSCQVTEEFILNVYILGQKRWFAVSPQTYQLVQIDADLLVEFEMTRVRRRIRNVKMASGDTSSFALARIKNKSLPTTPDGEHVLH